MFKTIIKQKNMKKISSAILLTTFFVFINCKSQVADKESVKGIAKGIKEIVEAAGGSEKLKAVAAKGENNKKAGKLFGKVDGANGGDSEAASKAAGAVSAVSGEQILSAIVKAAGAADQDGKKPGDAKNPIAAAIGDKDGDAEFEEEMKKDDQIAAAIALRGMAKDGKFAVKNNGEKGKAEGAIKGAGELLDKLVKAVKTAEGASSGTDAIGEVVADAAKAADKESVTGIAKGIKEIVEAAGGSSEKLKAVAAAKGGNEKAGKLFGKVDAANGDSEAATTLTNRKSFGFNPSHLTLYSLNRYFYYLNKHKAIDSELKIEITKLKVNCDYIVLRYSLNATH